MKAGIFIIAVVIFAIIMACLIYPHLWWLSIPLGCWFLLLQVVAISNWSRKHEFFKYTDYLYYLVIGIAVFIGSKHIGSDMIDYIDSMVGKETIESRLIVVIAEIPVTRELFEKHKKNIANIDPAQWIKCDTEIMRKRLEGTMKTDHEYSTLELPKLEFSECSVVSANMLSEHKYKGKLIDLKTEKEYLERKLKILNEKETVFTREQNIINDFLIVPAIFLAGIALKIGKTTCSITS